MSMTTDGLSYWQDESAGIDLFDTAIGDLLDRRAKGISRMVSKGEGP